MSIVLLSLGMFAPCLDVNNRSEIWVLIEDDFSRELCEESHWVCLLSSYTVKLCVKDEIVKSFLEIYL